MLNNDDDIYPRNKQVRQACTRVGLTCQRVGFLDDYVITDEASGERMGKRRMLNTDEVLLLVDKREKDHRWKAVRLLHLCPKLLNPRETDFLRSIQVQRYALSEKQERWLSDIQAGVEAAAARRR
jgi:hypothetical protein